MSTTYLTRSKSRGSDFELAYASPIVSQTVLKRMGADMASLHRHNSKKYRPRALNDEAGKPSEDGRKRRSRGSSDDEGKIAEDGFSNEDLRVGGPYLCSIPLKSYPLSKRNLLHALLQHKVSGEDTISSRIHRILRNRNISLLSAGPYDSSVKLFLRQSDFNPEPEPIPTIVISARRQVVDDLWLQTARQIYFLLRQEKFGHVSVEILDPQALCPPTTLPVAHLDPMFNKWDSVLAQILRAVDRTDIQHIGCFRRGRNIGNENPVTVLVIVHFNSKKNWRATRDLIADILKRSNLPMVAVEIVKDKRVSLMADVKEEKGFKMELLDGRAMAGGPIAHIKNNAAPGTLGGFVELQNPKNLKWYCFALTCFHVVNPQNSDLRGQELAAVQKWRNRGLSMQNTKEAVADGKLAEQYLLTSHPTLRAKKEQIGFHQGSIDDYHHIAMYSHGLELMRLGLFETLSERKQASWNFHNSVVKDCEKRIDDIEKFFHNSRNILGPVKCASGFRSKNLHTLDGASYPTNLDWALVKVDTNKRPPSNKVNDLPPLSS